MKETMETDVAFWFDINNIEHLKAWRHLENTGSLPKHFVPVGVELSTNWKIKILARMAGAYLERELSGEE